MTDTPTDALTEGLHAAADDHGRPLTTDVHDLLGRARRARGRRRAATGAAAVVVVAAVTTAVLVVPSLGGGDGPSRGIAPGGLGTTASDPTPAPQADAVLDDREVVRRCLPQLEKYFDLPQYARADWKVAHDRAYRAGDVVQLATGLTTEIMPGVVVPAGPNPVLCAIPEAGQEDVPVPFSRFEVSSTGPVDEARLTELCAEASPSVSRSDDWVDLRGADVLAVDRDGGVAEALLRIGRQRLDCQLAPPEWDSLMSTTEFGLRGEISLSGSTTGIKSLVPEKAAYYYGAGVTRADAARLRITLVDGQSFERPVGPGGAWAVMLKVPGAQGLVNHTIDVLAADGSVLDSYSTDF